MSEKTVAQKLLIKPGQRVLLVNAPASVVGLLDPLPENVQLITTLEQQPAANVVLLIAHHRADLERLLPAVTAGLPASASLWVLYYKGTSAVKTDINRDSIWSYAKTLGFTGVSMISVDEDWSAMRLKQISVGQGKAGP